MTTPTETPPALTKPHCTKFVRAQRVDDVLRILIDGAQTWDVRDFVREKEKEPGSVWFVGEGESQLSASQIGRYVKEASRLIMKSHEKCRAKLFRRHLAQRRSLYARAVNSGDVRTALACLADEAKLLDLYPDERRGRKNGNGNTNVVVNLFERVEQYAEILRKLSAGALPGVGSGQPVVEAQADRPAIGVSVPDGS